MKRHASITLDRVMDAVQQDDNIGICRACGAEARCEPDARNYTCEECGAREVFGAEELLMQMA